jgi:flavorubredoxin
MAPIAEKQATKKASPRSERWYLGSRAVLSHSRKRDTWADGSVRSRSVTKGETEMANVLILYHSQQFGNTRAMAEAIARGVTEAGADATSVNTNEDRMDLQSYRGFDAVAFGSPDYYSYIAGGLKVFLDDWFIARKADAAGLEGKPYGLFYSHGGGGRVRQPLESLFERMGTKVSETIECVSTPSEEVLEACAKLGRELAQAATNG